MSDKSLLTAVRSDLSVKQAEAERIASTFKVDEKGRFSIEPEQHADYVKAVNEAKSAKAVLDGLEASAAHREYLDAPAEPSIAGQHYGQPLQQGNEFKQFSDVLLQSDAYRAALEAGAFSDQASSSKPINLFSNVEGKSIFNYTAGSVSLQALGAHESTGMHEQAKRKWHIRDLFPKSTTKAAMLHSVRETGWVNNAAMVNQKYAADGVNPAVGNPATDKWGNAPESFINLTGQIIPIATIKHQLKAHKSILADEGRLRTFLDTRMVDGIKYAEDRDLLTAVGGPERITGLYNQDDVQEYTGLATDKHSVQIRRAITKAMLAEYDPTGLVISPTMWESVEVETDNTGAFRVLVSVAIGAEKRVWQLSVVSTTAMGDDKFLLGAFGMGSMIHDRESVSVAVSSEHDRNFTEGTVTFLAEERLAFECVRPESHVIGTWTPPA